MEVQFVGPKFTWTNFQEGDKRIYRSLDWSFVNVWFKKIGEPVCSVIPWSLSDHCSLLIEIKRTSKSVKSPFRFFNMWCEHPVFFNIVERIWCTPIIGSNMFKVYQKLKLLCAELKVLNRRDFGLISERISQTRESLKESQRSLLNDPFNGDLQRKEKNLLTELQRMLL